MVGLPFAVALTITDELRSGDVATIEYLFPSLSITNPTSARPTNEVNPFVVRAPTTAAMVEDVLFEDDPSDDRSPSIGDDCGGLTATTNEDVPGKMCWPP